MSHNETFSMIGLQDALWLFNKFAPEIPPNWASCSLLLLSGVTRVSHDCLWSCHVTRGCSFNIWCIDLKWQPLQLRHKNKRLTMLYKMMNNLVAVPALDYLTLSSSNTISNNSLKYPKSTQKLIRISIHFFQELYVTGTYWRTTLF